MWFIYALFSAIAAAGVAIFGKLGLKDLDSTLATTIRGIIMAAFLVLVSLFIGKFKNFSFHSISGKDWFLITMAGICGAVSWLFYFLALKNGPAPAVAAIDRLSIVFVVILAAMFLKDDLRWQSILGAVLITFGAVLITQK